MVRSLLKGIFFLSVSGFFAFGLIYIVGMPGSLRLTLSGTELSISIFLAVCLLVLILLLFLVSIFILNLILASIKFISGDETAISRYFFKSRQRKGNKALLNALISFYEGDSVDALLQSTKANYGKLQETSEGQRY